MRKKEIVAVIAVFCSAVICLSGCSSAGGNNEKKSEAVNQKEAGPGPGADSNSGKEAEKENAVMAGVANPWSGTDEAGIKAVFGTCFTVPQGAEGVLYRMLESQKLAEMQYTLGGVSLNARMKIADKWEDISGMYYTWDKETACQIDGHEGKAMMTADRTAQICLWRDEKKEIMYCVSVSAPDLEDFDIAAAASGVSGK